MLADMAATRLARLKQTCTEFFRPQMDVDTLGRIDMSHPASWDNADKTAIVICHGMGQQVRWQTLGELVDALRATGSVETVGTRLARFEDTHGDFVLGRVDLTIHGPRGEHREIHLYESYWAPITEGGVRLRDVVAFLKDAGFRGMRYALKPFVRFMFGQPREFQKRAQWVAFPLAVVLAVFFALLSLNASIAAVTAQGVLSPQAVNARSSATLYVAAVEVSALFYFLVTVLVSLWRDRRRRRTPTYCIHGLTRRMLKVLLGFVGVVTIAAGVVVPLDLAQMGPGWLRLTVELPWPVTAAVWAGAAWLAARTRRLLVQYVGDVVAYVSGFQVSRYDEIRNKIQDTGKRILCALYRDGGYGSHIVVGHSLGSVVAYDALNASISEDRWHPQRKMRVVERTRAFITFGSPLDKIAFIFRTQSHDGDVREALASQVQPLIDETRRPDWINIFSRQDPISASLEFYNNPDRPEFNVRNVEDHQADLPLLAHTQYWRNQLLAETILEHVPAGAVAAA